MGFARSFASAAISPPSIRQITNEETPGVPCDYMRARQHDGGPLLPQ